MRHTIFRWIFAALICTQPLFAEDGITFDAAQRILRGEMGGASILQLQIEAVDDAGNVLNPSTWQQNLQVTWPTANRAVQFTLNGNTLRVTGTANGPDAFPCTPEAVSGQTQVLRGSSGMSSNLRNSGIYARSEDWALAFTGAGKRSIVYSKETSGRQEFSVSVTGSPVTVKLITGRFKSGLGMNYYNPKYQLPSTVPAGWISWKAYGAGITEAQVKSVTDWMSANLKDFGLEYVIVDDGWFEGSNGSMMHSVPANVDWTKANSRFPSGVKGLADYVHGKGLKVGLWYSPFGCSNTTMESQNSDWWVKTSSGGAILKSGWHGAMFADATVQNALDNWITRGVKAGRANGVDYFKCDGMKHVAYDAYGKSGNYFSAKGTTWQAAMRKGWDGLVSASGSGYIMSCWDRVPEIASLPKALRIGGDKSSSWSAVTAVADDLRKWFHEHNIVWCDDPDHMVFVSIGTPECRTWSTLVGITGTHLTFSDKTDVYNSQKLELLRRIIPVVSGPVVRSCELYGLSSTPALWALEIARPFENWLIVANTAASSQSVTSLNFKTLGLEENVPYTVYDFWNKTYKGVFTGSYSCGAPPSNDTQLFGIRRARAYPWIISTNRHITQGGVDLTDVKWDGASSTLSGTSKVVNGDQYVITLYTPEGATLTNAKFGTASATLGSNGTARTMSFTPASTGEVSWSAQFSGVVGIDGRPTFVPFVQEANISLNGTTLTVHQEMSGSQRYSIQIYDASGRILESFRGSGAYTRSIPMAHHGAGMRIVNVITGARVATHRFMVVQ